MDTSLLVEAGLTDAQALTYIELIKNSPISPPKLATITGETRTNTYKILEQLQEIDLVQRDESAKKIQYWAKNPTALLQYVEEEQEKAALRTKKIKNSLPEIMSTYLKHNEQPGVRFYQGKEGIKKLYDHTIRASCDMYVIRSPHDAIYMSDRYYEDYQEKRAKKGIRTHLLSAKRADPMDKIYNKNRTYLPLSIYDARAEFSVFNDEVAIVSFGSEAIGMLIESPQVAEAIRQLFHAVKGGLSS